MRRLFKWLLILAVLAGAAYGVSIPAGAWLKARSQMKYLTAKVTTGKVETTVNSTGTVKPVRTVTIGSFVSGPIIEMRVDFNSEVKKGDLLARIDPLLTQAAYDRDQATLKVQEADKKRVQALLEQAEANERRGMNLRKINVDYLSENELDQLRANTNSLKAQLLVADANIDQAKASLKNSKSNLDYTKIVSLEDGIIIERKVDKGQTVASAFQTPEMFILAPRMREEMHVYASVDEADIGQINNAAKAKKAVRFTVDAYPQDIFNGKILEIRKNSTTTQNVVTYPVIVTVANPELKLMPGMTASLSFSIEERSNVKRIPSAALRFVPPVWLVHPEDRKLLDPTQSTETRSGVRLSAEEKAEAAKKRSKRLVWVEGVGGLRAKQVTLGLSDNQNAELVEGDLAEGDELVTGTETPLPGR